MTEKATPNDDRNARLRSLAAVDEVLREPAAEALLERYPRALVVDAVRTILERLRAEILAGGPASGEAGVSGEAGAAGGSAAVTPAPLVPGVARLLGKHNVDGRGLCAQLLDAIRGRRVLGGRLRRGLSVLRGKGKKRKARSGELAAGARRCLCVPRLKQLR